jgi:hypothetical protein
MGPLPGVGHKFQEQKVTETDGGGLGNMLGGGGLVLCNGFLEMDFVMVGIIMWNLQTGP